MRLTEKQRYALSLLIFMGGSMGSNDWFSHYQVHRQTTKSLMKKGLIRWGTPTGGDGIRITDDGRKFVKPREAA